MTAEAGDGKVEPPETLGERLESVRFNVPTRGNRRLEKFVERAAADPQVRAWWHLQQVGSERLGMSDHSWVHIQIVANIALRMLRLAHRAGIEPAMVTDHGMRDGDAEVVVLAGAMLHDTGMSIHRVDHEAFSLFLAEPKLRELLDGIYDEPELTVVVSEALHCIIGHRRRGEPYTLEAGVVRVADALDMAQGRSRLPVERGDIGIHSISAAAIDDVTIERRGGAPDQDRDQDEQLGRHLPGRRPARDQDPRHPARGPHRGARRDRGGDREAPPARVPDLAWFLAGLQRVGNGRFALDALLRLPFLTCAS